MKRWFSLITAIVLLFCSLQVSFAEDVTFPCDGYTTKNSVVIRSKASTKGKQIGRLPQKGTKVTVHGREMSGKVTWYQITTAEGKDGYIRGDLLRVGENGTPAPVAKTEKTKEQTPASDAKSILPQKLAVGDRVTLGKWEQDGKAKNGKESIEWRVLDIIENRALLISVKGIDTQMYDPSTTRTDLYWGTSWLNQWLNEEFYASAFSKDEKALIYLTPNDSNKKYVFCLSSYEAKKYFSDDADMACKPSAYAKKKIGKKGALDSNGYGMWWLSDLASSYENAGYYNFMNTTYNTVAYVNQKKGIETYEGLPPLYNDAVLVRPAIWITVPSLSEKLMPNNLLTASIGDHIVFGAYEQDGNDNNGKEPIEWRVLDKKNDRLLVISRYVLDIGFYNEGKAYSGVTWEKCTLRKWLNNDFTNTAFNANELAMIPTVTIGGDEYLSQDQIFLLSYKEVDKYFSDSASAKRCQPTTRVRNEGLGLTIQGYASWWLRSDSSSLAAPVFDWKGTLQETRIGWFEGIRPAMWIDLASDIN